MDEMRLIGLDLSMASPEAIEVLIADAPDPAIYREILSSNSKRPEVLRILVESEYVPDEIREQTGRILSIPVRQADRSVLTDEGRRHGMLQKIQRLSVGERIALALRGGQEIRSILIKDPNKEVVLTVLKNPKITDTEVEMIAHSRNVPEDALRAIHKNREWMKNYSIALALVNNPKTPSGISMTLVSGLRLKDLTVLEKNRNVPEAVRAVAKKILTKKRPG